MSNKPVCITNIIFEVLFGIGIFILYKLLRSANREIRRLERRIARQDANAIQLSNL